MRNKLRLLVLLWVLAGISLVGYISEPEELTLEITGKHASEYLLFGVIPRTQYVFEFEPNPWVWSEKVSAKEYSTYQIGDSFTVDYSGMSDLDGYSYESFLYRAVGGGFVVLILFPLIIGAAMSFEKEG